MSFETWCKHYNGLHSKICRAGVSYKDLQRPDEAPLHLPCFKDEGCTERCEKASFRTPEEVAEEDRKVDEALRKYQDNIKNDICPHCGAPIKEKKQVGRCVYANCGCRLYQGTLPKQEKKSEVSQGSLWE